MSASSDAVKHKDKVNLEECAYCANTENLKKCSRCQLVSYCSKECQTVHWKSGGHRQFCVPPQERNPDKHAADTETTNMSICLICRSDISNAAEAEILTLPCAHIFHVNCILSAAKYGTSQLCPACRAPLPLPKMLKFIEASMLWSKLLKSHKARTGHDLDCKCHTRTPSELCSLRVCVKLFTESAELGNLEAAFFMGMYHQRIQPDFGRAVYYLKFLAAEMHVRAQYMIGVMYLNGGPGLKINRQKGLHFLRLSAAQGDHEAQCVLGTVLRASEIKTEQAVGFALLKESALQNNAAAICDLGAIYYEGSITDKSYERAFQYIERAALQGCQQARYMLSGLFKRGHGCAQSHRRAQEWLLKAETDADESIRNYVANWFHEHEC